MTPKRTYISAYDHRVRLVTKALVERSELAAEAAQPAVHVLRTIDHIPEKVR